MLIFGHRGAAGLAPENTLEGFRRAIALDADGVEFDVRAVDAHAVVLHDASVDRTTDGHGDCAGFSIDELRRLRTANGERIPLLAEALAAVCGLAWVNVEIKSPGITDLVLDELAQARGPGWRARILLSAFDMDTTAELAQQRGDCLLGLLYDEPFENALERARSLDCWSLHLPLSDVSAASIGATRAAGLRAYVYTVNARNDLERCRDLGVDGVFTDYPDRGRAAVPGHDETTP